MIIRIEIYNYRCFAGLDVRPGEYNVLAGANGAGKTTLLDIPVLLGDLLRVRRCSEAFLEPLNGGRPARAHRLQELIHKEQKDQYLLLAVEAIVPRNVVGKLSHAPIELMRLRYEISFQIFKERDLYVKHEFLHLYSGKSLTGNSFSHQAIDRRGDHKCEFAPENNLQREPYRFKIDAARLALGDIPSDTEQFPVTNWFRDSLLGEAVFYTPDVKGLQKACPPGLGDKIIASGINLPWLILQLKQRAPENLQDWIDHVQTALPQVNSITARERDDDHYAYLQIGYRGGYSVTSSGLSEGTARILALTILPYLVIEQPSILALEEPETGIHPQAIESVLQSLSSIYDAQVWISTHSPVVLAHTDLKDVLCMRLNPDGSATAVRGDQHPRLQDWQGTIDLGSLFAAGILE